jgi:hypothetical protein
MPHIAGEPANSVSSSLENIGALFDWRSNEPGVRKAERVSPLMRRTLIEYGGAYRDRTDDLMLAKQPLSQLS